MRVGVDSNLCSGHARCWATAPEIFTLDGEGYSNIGTGKDVPPDLEEDARRGIRACPERALYITESDGS
jgi:ferredoxin